MDNLDSYKIYRHQFVNLVLLCSFGGEFKPFLQFFHNRKKGWVGLLER